MSGEKFFPSGQGERSWTRHVVLVLLGVTSCSAQAVEPALDAGSAAEVQPAAAVVDAGSGRSSSVPVLDASRVVVVDAARPAVRGDTDAAIDRDAFSDAPSSPDAQATSDGGRGLVEADASVALAVDPGSGPWVKVARDDVRSVCKLDPDALERADKILDTPWLAVRYGRLCHAYKVDGMAPTEGFSAAKILGATVTGAVAYQTRDLVRRGRKTGPFSDDDRADFWADRVGYNADAHVGHVLGMVAQSKDLSLGKRSRQYDVFGWVQLDSLGPMLNAALAQDPARLGADLDVFVKRSFFAPLGMRQSTWSDGIANKAFGWTWATTPYDMARLGLLILRGGLWNGQRILDKEWTYRMTHPAFEDADTGFGYSTWLNSSSNWTMGEVAVPAGWEDDIGKRPRFPGPCAPVSVHRSHPHGLSLAPDCNYDAPYTCAQTYDVGVWQSVAGFGKVIQGHPGLDLVLVGWDVTPDDFFAMPSAGILWDAVKPAVIAADATYAGNEAGFCAAYGSNRYAPDLR